MPPKRKVASTKATSKSDEPDTKAKRGRNKVDEKAEKNEEVAVEKEEQEELEQQSKPTNKKKGKQAKEEKQKNGKAEEEDQKSEELNGVDEEKEAEDDEEIEEKPTEKSGAKKGKGRPAKGKKGKEATSKEADDDMSEKADSEKSEEVETENPPVSRRRRAAASKPPPKDESDEEEEQLPKKRSRAVREKASKKTREPTPDEDDEEEKPKRGRARKAPPKKVEKESAAPQNKTETEWNEADFECTKENAKGEQPNLKICAWNVGGLRSWIKKDGLKIFQYANPDILFLQETKCSEDKIPDEVQEIEGYKKYWCASKKEGYAGVALFSKTEPVDVKYGIDNEDHDDDGRCITAEYENFYLVGVYVPNAGRGLVTLSKRLDFNTAFLKYIESLEEKKPVIICGDMNVAHNEIDLANPKTNTKTAGFTKEEREGMTEFLSQGHVDTYRKLYPDQEKAYTFWSYITKSRAKNVGCGQPSRIVEDIIALEVDFKHNLSLLKIRESEIDRCTKTNETLQETLDSTISELYSLNMKYTNLMGDFRRFETCRLSEAEHYRRRIDLLEQQLNQCIEHELRMQREYKENISAQEEKFKAYYEKQLDAQKKIYEKINLDIHKKYDRENKIALNLQNALDEVISKNLELQNKIRNIESQRISDACFFNSEKELNQSKISDMQKEIQKLKLENVSLKEKADTLEKDNNMLKQNFSRQNSYLNSVKEESENIYTLNEQLIEKLKHLTKANNELEEEIKNLTHDKDKLANELCDKTSSVSCNAPEHLSFESILKQNKILQAVIKETKRSRESLQQENIDLCEAATKIEKLEAVVEHLKKVIVSNRRLPVEMVRNRCISTENNL